MSRTKESRGHDRPSNQRDLGMIGMNSFAYVQQVLSPFVMNNLKDHILGTIHA